MCTARVTVVVVCVCVCVVSRSQTVTLAVTVWTTAVERFVLSSPGSRVGDKCERYRKGHESHYIQATPSVEYSTLYTPRLVCNEIHALCGTARTNSTYHHTHPTSGGTRNETL